MSDNRRSDDTDPADEALVELRAEIARLCTAVADPTVSNERLFERGRKAERQAIREAVEKLLGVVQARAPSIDDGIHDLEDHGLKSAYRKVLDILKRRDEEALDGKG